MEMKTKFLFVTIIITLTAGFLIGIEFQKSKVPTVLEIEELSNKETDKPESVDFSLFWDAWKQITEKHVDRSNFDIKNMVFGSIEGMINSLQDPYSVFLKPQEAKKFKEEIRGSFGGVGIEIGIRSNVLTVIAPIKGTPAYEAGLLAGDKIVKVDGEDTVNITIDEAVTKIRGERGTKVTLTVFRDSFEKPKDFDIIRDIIKIPAASWKILEDNIGYIQIHTFNSNIDREFRKAAQLMIDQNTEGIIIDVRNNPGGLLGMAVKISSWFLEKGELVVIEDFGNGEKDEFRAENIGLFKDTPVVILINKGSASASEILAGALHDHRDIKLIGEKTYGKGSVQQIEELKEGSLKITVAKWLTPNGTSISDEGITPDIIVELTDEDREADRDPQLEKAIEIIRTITK